ncbi:MAG: hypothetical protein RLZZ223_206 [Candidatus Parcubacteria bacterium]|jgi:hypothetical protein
MSKRAIKIWAVVILISIFGIIATYVLLGNNGSSVSKGQLVEQESTNQEAVLDTSGVNINIDNTSTNPSDILSRVNPANTNKSEYSLEYIIPRQLLDRLFIDTNNFNANYHYSLQYKLAFKYENKNIDGLKDVIITENATDNKIYVHTEPKDIQSGQSIEIISIKSELQNKSIDEIILNQILDLEQQKLCKIEQKNSRYSIIARDIKVKDSTSICGLYSKGNNRFFVKPQESTELTTRLIFVNAGTQEISYDGSGQGKYWYESVVLE